MRLLIIIAVICLGYGAYKFYETKSDTQIDYKIMNERGIPREMIDSFFTFCVNDRVNHGAQKDFAVKLCTCHANGMIGSMSKEEFIRLNATLHRQASVDPAIDRKIAESAVNCRTKYSAR